MDNLNINITIKDNRTGEYYKIPVIPSKLEYKEGDAMVDTVKVLNRGNVDFFSGVDLDSMAWSSFFPARYDAGYCKVSEAELLDPLEYKGLFNSWKNDNQALQLIIPVLEVNQEMYIASFTWDNHGFEKDIYYNLNLTQHRRIKPKQYNTDTGTIEEPDQETTADRQPVPEKELPNPYTVKTGDTLTLIAKRYNTDWQSIYNENQETIGPDPNNLEPGQELFIV